MRLSSKCQPLAYVVKQMMIGELICIDGSSYMGMETGETLGDAWLGRASWYKCRDASASLCHHKHICFHGYTDGHHHTNDQLSENILIFDFMYA